MKPECDTEQKLTTVLAVNDVDPVEKEVQEIIARALHSRQTFKWCAETKQLRLPGHVDATHERLIRVQDIDVIRTPCFL